MLLKNSEIKNLWMTKNCNLSQNRKYIHQVHFAKHNNLIISFTEKKKCCFFHRRIAVRQDTYCVSAISLNMTEKVHPIIWTVNNLPFDCQMIQAVQKPIGKVNVDCVQRYQ